MTYCRNLFNYQRRKSSPVNIAQVPLGGSYPVRIQSMTNCSTLDTVCCVEQIKKIVAAGADYVRLTAQGTKEAENLGNIRRVIRKQGVEVPLIADIHFNPKAAEMAASQVEKVRINPGNFADPLHIELPEGGVSDLGGVSIPELEKQKIRERLLPLLAICKKRGTALRIGVNHGSLSSRMMLRYGDSPRGMVESCMEYLRICVEEDFSQVVISIKSSNTLAMIYTVRLLVKTMEAEGMNFPLHLGVTEAGDGEDGRIKSAVGIGSLLLDGIGDTVRVSLSEDPEVEIPVARKLVEYVEERKGHALINAKAFEGFDPYSYKRRESKKAGIIGKEQVPVVIQDHSQGLTTDYSFADPMPDFIYLGAKTPEAPRKDNIPQICDYRVYREQTQCYPLFEVAQIEELSGCKAALRFLRVCHTDLNEGLLQQLEKEQNLVLWLYSSHLNAAAEMRAAFHTLLNLGSYLPVVVAAAYSTEDVENLQVQAATDFGFLLADGFGDGVCISAGGLQAECLSLMFGILQATRSRISKTEYISCPGCGRTLFNLQSTLAKVKAGTSHLKGLKIAVMGCIVNGPGEMADADYGYVGAGRGRISLYKGKLCVEKNIPEEEALERLLDLIQKDR